MVGERFGNHVNEKGFCTICNEESNLTNQIDFGPLNTVLPSQYSFFCCPACDFGFSRPKNLTSAQLDQYYANTQNDHSFSFTTDSQGRFENQFTNIVNLLGDNMQSASLFESNSTVRVLDYGCGEGGLLYQFANSKIDAQFDLFGVDLLFRNPRAKIDVSNRFSKSIELDSDLSNIINKGSKFDLAIISHTLEHLLNFSILNTLNLVLDDNSYLVVEVPDAGRYQMFPRKTPYYYFDRLHINHFTPNSLAKLLGQYGFAIHSFLRYEFEYGDGFPYPSLLAIFTKRRELNFTEIDSSERIKLQALRSSLPNQLVVWGVGDNFFRLKSFGFFESVEITNFIDRLYTGQLIQGKRVISLQDAITNIPNLFVLVTVSWNNESIREILEEANVKYSFI